MSVETQIRPAQDNPPTQDLAHGLAILLAYVAFHLYVYLAQRYPAVYWYDAHNRLALRDQILLGRWLPLTQFVVFAVSRFSTNLFVLRFILAGIAALTVIAMYRLASSAFGSAAGLIAAGLLATNLMFTALATVPYPEVLFVGLILAALYYLDGPSRPRNLVLGMLALNLACLTRYEGWLLAAVIVADTAVRSWAKATTMAWIGNTARTAAMAACAPLAWLILGVNSAQGLLGRLQAVIGFEQDRLTPNPLLPIIDPEHIRDFAVNFYHLLNWQAGLPIILAGAAGWAIAILKAPRRDLHVRISIFVLLDFWLLALWRPWDFSNLRQAFIAQVFLIFYAAYGVVQVVPALSNGLHSLHGTSLGQTWQNRAAAALAIWLIFTPLPNSIRFVADSSQQRDFDVPRQVGTWLRARLQPRDLIWVLSDDVFPAYSIATYTGRPFETVLDHRFDEQTLQSKLRRASEVYIVELFGARSGLSAADGALLGELEARRMPAQEFVVAGTVTWVTSGGPVLAFLSGR